MSDCFSENYEQARDRFVQCAQSLNANLDSYQLSAKGPRGITLTTDFAWIGTDTPKKILLVQSGVHGVEGFAGAAIQCQLLKENPVIPSNTALVLVHVLNPFGMAWLRRVNESNVDLNRNCLPGDKAYLGMAAGYEELNQLINPASPPGHDAFVLKALVRILRSGVKPIKQAVAQGQYEYPSGLFYGGTELEEGPKRFQQWIAEHIPPRAKVWVLDLHTGLGSFGEYQLFLNLPIDGNIEEELRQVLGEALVKDKIKKGGYKITGGISNLYNQVLDSPGPTYLTIEFGTYSPLRVLHALREENRCHFYTEGEIQHPCKKKLKKIFCPDSETWRKRTVSQGVSLVNKMVKVLGASS
ncbi:MAG: DUF2817 domain-containing protein [Arenicellales bacterium]|nr:DUF2817 domain-containing protein [Arenicellales bacterium]